MMLRYFPIVLFVAGCSAEDYRTARFALDGGSDMQNSPPEVVDDEVTVDEDDSVVFDVLANDSDPDDDNLTVFVADNPGQGELTILGGGEFRYAPRANFSGVDTMAYGVLDGFGHDVRGTVTFTIAELNDPPVFSNEPGATYTTRVGAILEVALRATDLDDSALTFGVDSFDAVGPYEINETLFVWRPAAEDEGSHGVAFFVDDGTDRATLAATLEVLAQEVDDCENPEDCLEDEGCQTDEQCLVGVCIDGSCGPDPCAGIVCEDGQQCMAGRCESDTDQADEDEAPRFENEGGCTTAAGSGSWTVFFLVLLMVIRRRRGA